MGLFKRKAEFVVTVSKPELVKTSNKLVEEIHETFFTEVDRLLKEAKIAKPVETTKQYLIDKSERLKNLGFSSTKEVGIAESEINRLEKLKYENENKKDLIEAINYFSVKYPQYKFITEESVKKICNKYGLIFGEVNKYIGDVPEKNLKHIEQFKIKEVDECCVEETVFLSIMRRPIFKRYMTKLEKIEQDKVREYNVSWDMAFDRICECPLEIAAPPSDFDTTNMGIKDFKLSKKEIPDPVVLKPVIFKEQKHYLIITAWGEEASDEMVVNETMN